MNQFDVYKVGGLYFAVMPNDYLLDAPHILVARLIPRRPADPVARPLTVPVEVGGKPLLFAPVNLEPAPRSRLKTHIGSIAEHRDDIVRALDFYITGF